MVTGAFMAAITGDLSDKLELIGTAAFLGGGAGLATGILAYAIKALSELIED